DRRFVFNVDKTKGAKNLPRIRHLIQALLRFEPDSELAVSAVDTDGKAISWDAIRREACGEDNPLEGTKFRAIVTRVVTKNKFGMYVPQFKVPPGVSVRTSKVIDGQ